MIDIKRVQEIKKEVKETTEASLRFFDAEYKKFIEKLTIAIKEFNEESVKIQRDIIETTKVLKEYDQKAKAIKSEYIECKKTVGDLNKKKEEFVEREDELLKLHKTLVNRGKILDAKENITKF